MSNARATEAMRKYAKPGGLLDYGPELSPVLVRLQRDPDPHGLDRTVRPGEIRDRLDAARTRGHLAGDSMRRHDLLCS